MKIPYPDDVQIQSISSEICKKALPKRTTVFEFIKNMYSGIGLRKLFLNSLDIAILSITVFIVAGIVFPSSITLAAEADKLVIFLFGFSPLFFAINYGASLWKEHSFGTYAVKMTCRYTVQHLLAYRMLVSSLTGTILNGIYVVILCSRVELPLITMLCISFSSLFVFAMLLIILLLRYDSVISIVMLYGFWIFGNIVLSTLWPKMFITVLYAIPVGMWIIIDIALLTFFLNRYSVYLNRRIRYAGD